MAIKVVQFEPAQGNQFFVELQVLERCGELWNVGYYSGSLKTVQTEELMAIYSLHRPQKESWRAVRTEYAARKAEVQLQNTAPGENRTVRLIRTLEGSWALVGIRVDPEENVAPVGAGRGDEPPSANRHAIGSNPGRDRSEWRPFRPRSERRPS